MDGPEGEEFDLPLEQLLLPFGALFVFPIFDNIQA